VAEQKEGALSVYRVLDLADSKGAYCTKLLADLGADVIKIEPPQGDSTRSIPPFVDDIPHLEKSLYFLYRHSNKRGITLDLETPEGKDIFQKLVKTADVLVETYPPGYMASLNLDYPVLKEINGGLIMASITEFGQTGPYKDWKGSDIVDFAMSGVMISSGFSGKVPCNLPGTPACDATSLIAAISILVALYHRGTTGKGQYIDAAVHESSRIGLFPWLVPIYSHALTDERITVVTDVRLGDSIYPVYPCKDGYVRVLGDPEVLRLPEWQDFIYRIGNAEDLYTLMVEFTPNYTRFELFEAGHREGVPIIPIHDMAGFVNNPHTKAREFFVEVNHPVIGKAFYPGPPYKWTETPASIRHPAPCLGEHNEEIYCRELGFSKGDLSVLRRAGVV